MCCASRDQKGSGQSEKKNEQGIMSAQSEWPHGQLCPRRSHRLLLATESTWSLSGLNSGSWKQECPAVAVPPLMTDVPPVAPGAAGRRELSVRARSAIVPGPPLATLGGRRVELQWVAPPAAATPTAEGQEAESGEMTAATDWLSTAGPTYATCSCLERTKSAKADMAWRSNEPESVGCGGGGGGKRSCVTAAAIAVLRAESDAAAKPSATSKAPVAAVMVIPSGAKEGRFGTADQLGAAPA